MMLQHDRHDPPSRTATEIGDFVELHWNPPLDLRSAIDAVCADQYALGAFRHRIEKSICGEYSDPGAEAREEFFQATLHRLLSVKRSKYLFGGLLTVAPELKSDPAVMPLVNYAMRAANSCRVDPFRRTQAERRAATRKEARETARREERAAADRRAREQMELLRESRPKIDALAAAARDVADHIQWNSLLLRIHPRWELAGGPFEPWPGTTVSDVPNTRNSHAFRARAVLRDILVRHRLDEDLARLVRAIFWEGTRS